MRLLSDSPLLDAGTSLPYVPDDFLGTSRPQGSRYDIGAFERVTGADETPPMPTTPAFIKNP